MTENEKIKKKTDEKTKEHVLLEKMIVQAKPAGKEPPTPQPKKGKSDPQEKDKE